jgi:hypothetical protein
MFMCLSVVPLCLLVYLAATGHMYSDIITLNRKRKAFVVCKNAGASQARGDST